MQEKKFSKLAWLGAVRRCKAIPAAQRLVIEHIGDTSDEHGRNAWKANDLLADELGVSPDTVKRARAAAVTHGLMVMSKPAPRSRGNRKTHEYRLLSGGSSAPTNGAPIDNSQVISGGRSAPTNGLVGAAEVISGGSSAPLVGAGECTPSVTPSGSTSGKEPPTPTELETAPLPPTQDGAGKSLEVFRKANLTARSPAAQDIAKRFSDWVPTPLESGVLAQVAVQIDKCLQSGITPAEIAEGLKAWTASDSWSPTQIPMFVNKANNRRTGRTNGIGKPTEKAMGWDDALNELLADLGDQ
jgi:hypothetical protein